MVQTVMFKLQHLLVNIKNSCVSKKFHVYSYINFHIIFLESVSELGLHNELKYRKCAYCIS